jgi:hypothetical protein
MTNGGGVEMRNGSPPALDAAQYIALRQVGFSIVYRYSTLPAGSQFIK